MTIQQHAQERYLAGMPEFGDIDIQNDPRNFKKEALEELADCYNYIKWELKRRDINDRKILKELFYLYERIKQIGD